MRAHPSITRRAPGAALGAGLVMAVAATPLAVAKEPSGHASCMDRERAAISPSNMRGVRS